MAQRNQAWSPSPCSIIYSIRKQCAGQSISTKFCNGKALIKATKLPIQWHRFDHTHGIVEYPSCKLLKGESTSLPSCSEKETWSCHPKQWAAGAAEVVGELHTKMMAGKDTQAGWMRLEEKPSRRQATEWISQRAQRLSSTSEAWQWICFCCIQGTDCVNFLPPRAGLR